MPTEPTYKVASVSADGGFAAIANVTVDSRTTDGASSSETRWCNKDWSKYYGYYLTIPEVKMALDARAIWVCGKKWEAENSWDKVILDHIVGFGKSSFQEILQNCVVIRRINGD